MMLKCRCHGISGSCSLQSCWHVLPDFHEIGAYLKRKYDKSVHLPYAIDLNNLIPLMDRSEIGAILSAAQNNSQQQQLDSSYKSKQHHHHHHHQQQQQQHLHHQQLTLLSDNGPAYDGPLADQPAVAPTQQPALSTPPQKPRFLLSGHLVLPQNVSSKHHVTSTTTTTTTTSTTTSRPLSSGELDQESSNSDLGPAAATAGAAEDEFGPEQEMDQETDEEEYATMDEQQQQELLSKLSPLPRDQYQSMLRDLKLCNTQHQHHLHRNHSTLRHAHRHSRQVRLLKSHHLQARKSTIDKQHSSQQMHQYFLKLANQHLSSLLQQNREDLIHWHKSPDYCRPNLNHGFAGVEARVCNPTPGKPDSCDKLCCGRGHTTHVYKYWVQCDCKFKYCCDVVCSECQREIEKHVCR